MSGFARYQDVNGNGMNDAGDELIVPFNQQIQIASVTTDDLHLPVRGDSLGNDAEVRFTVGPGRHELTITMGASPSIKTRQDFNANVKTANAASGIDVSDASLPTIRNRHGLEARASTPIDVVPGFVDLDQAMEQLYNYSADVALGDVDGDGDLDAVVVNANQANRVYTNQ